MNSTKVRFPETVVSDLQIEFSLTQPLRLAEVGVTPKQQPVRTEGVRFLAQPGESYTVYLDPDRSYGRVSSGGSNLRSDAGVMPLPEYPIVANPTYVPSDRDDDGIPDTRDNCPRVANADQKDVDGNGQGDVCDDFDRDGVMTVEDNCPQTSNRNQRDTDGDGVGDVCDEKENRFTEANPWVPWVGIGIAALVLGGLMFSVVHLKPVPPAKREDEEGVVDATEKPESVQE